MMIKTLERGHDKYDSIVAMNELSIWRRGGLMKEKMQSREPHKLLHIFS